MKLKKENIQNGIEYSYAWQASSIQTIQQKVNNIVILTAVKRVDNAKSVGKQAQLNNQYGSAHRQIKCLKWLIRCDAIMINFCKFKLDWKVEKNDAASTELATKFKRLGTVNS